MNSPNLASAYMAYHSMDLLLLEQPIPFDCTYTAPDSIAKSYPFELNDFHPAHYDLHYSLDDIHKLQIQLYQELRNQVVMLDLRKDMHPHYDLASAVSTIDTPVLNTLMVLVPELAPTPDFVPETPKRAVPECEQAPLQVLRAPPKPADAAPKKHTRKHIMARLRNGCWICRIKHLKCDEHRPVCQNCTRFGIQCDYSADRPLYVLDKELRRVKLDTINTKKRRLARPAPK